MSIAQTTPHSRIHRCPSRPRWLIPPRINTGPTVELATKTISLCPSDAGIVIIWRCNFSREYEITNRQKSPKTSKNGRDETLVAGSGKRGRKGSRGAKDHISYSFGRARGSFSSNSFSSNIKKHQLFYFLHRSSPV